MFLVFISPLESYLIFHPRSNIVDEYIDCIEITKCIFGISQIPQSFEELTLGIGSVHQLIKSSIYKFRQILNGSLLAQMWYHHSIYIYHHSIQRLALCIKNCQSFIFIIYLGRFTSIFYK